MIRTKQKQAKKMVRGDKKWAPKKTPGVRQQAQLSSIITKLVQYH